HGKAEGRLAMPLDQAARHASTANSHNAANYLNPKDLAISPLEPRRVALIGSCLLESWRYHKSNPSNCRVDLMVVNGAGSLPTPESLGIAIQNYDFQLIQLPLRGILSDDLLWHNKYTDITSYDTAFSMATQRLALILKCRMDWIIKHNLLTFVSNFMVPQNN